MYKQTRIRNFFFHCIPFTGTRREPMQSCMKLTVCRCRSYILSRFQCTYSVNAANINRIFHLVWLLFKLFDAPRNQTLNLVRIQYHVTLAIYVFNLLKIPDNSQEKLQQKSRSFEKFRSRNIRDLTINAYLNNAKKYDVSYWQWETFSTGLVILDNILLRKL